MLRFKQADGSEYPDWKRLKIKDVCSVTNGKGNTQDKEDDGAYPFYVRSAKVEHSNKYIFDMEAVITSGDGVGVGKIYHYVKGKFNLHQRCYACYDFHDIDVRYFYHYFSSHFYKRAKSLSAKGSVDSVRMDFITDMNIDVPCDEEQQRIADCLSSVDNIIADYEAQAENLQNQKKGMMQKLFSQEIRFKAKDGSEYPNWGKGSIGDILKICHGKDYKQLKFGHIPVFGTGGIISYVNKPICDWECVCIGRKGTIDKPYYMNSPFWCVDTLFYSKPRNDQIVKFQYYLFETINWKQYNEASGVPSLSASTVESINIEVPVWEEQQKIADCLSSFDRAIEDLQKTVEHWKNIKKGLLQQLFA